LRPLRATAAGRVATYSIAFQKLAAAGRATAASGAGDTQENLADSWTQSKFCRQWAKAESACENQSRTRKEQKVLPDFRRSSVVLPQWMNCDTIHKHGTLR